MRILIFFLFFAGLALTLPAYAQTDSTAIKVDSSFIKPGTKPKKADTIRRTVEKPVIFKDSARIAIEKMPRQAAIRSAILPGLGQIHNKRWWKVPFIYGGFFAIGLAYDFNQRYYKEFLGEVQYRAEHNHEAKNPKYAGYSFEGMVAVKDSYRRNRDLSILGFVGMHAINIIDAYIDAKFFRFDISNDLSFRIDPSWQQTYSYASQIYLIKINLAL
jgi:hypothetical protein